MTTGKGTENKERNIELYNDWKNGKFTVVQLVAKYRISSQRIYSIVRRLEKQK